MPAAIPIIDEKKLRSWKLLDDFRRRLAKIRAEIPPPSEKQPSGPERLLLEEDYFSLMLFGMLNPVLDSRGYRTFRNFQAMAYWIAGGLTIENQPAVTH